MDIIFNFSDPLVAKECEKQSVNSSPVFLVGMMTKPIMSGSLGRIDLLGVRFKAQALSYLTTISFSDVTDKVIDLKLINGLIAHELVDELYEKSDEHRILYLERYFQEKFLKTSTKIPWMQNIIHAIEASNGNVDLEQLSRNTGISPRQIQRTFKKNIGIGPKKFGQVVRFNALKKFLDSGEKQSFLASAFDYGYYDHPHLTKSFKDIAGISPSEYLLNS
ncbi:helix-turn-helix transcriptional regulator [Fulvivirgaceae bacterium BMA10]|uniref:Helix-turn-helix transcriptional regulator n=2 Tax=Splendidivirga corallicola TaxID=3051826 RepID=A0ABT8KM53_9BACT|nr:helix-turn-helix transcriptional regulator [Fulvivirgaceae bacterium BMA10]